MTQASEDTADTRGWLRRAWEVAEDLFDWVWSYPLTNAVLLLGVVSLATVPQVQQVVFEGVSSLHLAQKLVHGAALAFAIGFHLLVLVAAAPMVHSRGEAPFEARLVVLVQRVPGLWRAVAAGRWVVQSTRSLLSMPLWMGKLGQRVALLVGRLWVGVGVSILVAFYFLAVQGSPLDHPWAVQVAFFIIVIGLCTSSAVRHGQHRVRPYPLTWQVAGARLFMAASVSMLVSQLLWMLAWDGQWGITFRPYTVWALFLGFYLMASASRLLELKLLTLPGRILGVVALSVAFILSATLWDPARPFAKEGTRANEVTLTEDWFEQFEARIQAAPEGPLILVAAAGGGTRAAAYTMMVLESLRRPDPLEPNKMLSSRIVAISSVSGGSLGAVHFAVNEQAAGNYSEDLEWKHIDGLSAKTAFEEGVSGKFVLRRTDLLDDMLQNFMAPTLRGMLFPGLSRGEGLAAFWQRAFGWTETIEDDVSPRPLLLINTTDVDTGDRVVVGFPRVPPGLLDGQYDTYSLSDYSLRIRPTLADGVRVSSAVPWGFDMPTMTAPCFDEPDEQCRVRFTDGGVFDNTGVHTLRALSARLMEAANRSSWLGERESDELSDRALELVNELQKRGVLLIEIDSGAKAIIPEHGPADSWGINVAGWGPLYDTFITPWNGMTYAAYSRESQTRGLQLAHVQATYAGRKAEHLVVSTLTFKYDPEDPAFGKGEITEVPTAWALSAESLGMLAGMFEVKREALESKMDVALHNLSVQKVHGVLIGELADGSEFDAGYDDLRQHELVRMALGSLNAEGGKPAPLSCLAVPSNIGSMGLLEADVGIRTLYPVIGHGEAHCRLAEPLLAYSVPDDHKRKAASEILDWGNNPRVGRLAEDTLVSIRDIVVGEYMLWAIVKIVDEGTNDDEPD